MRRAKSAVVDRGIAGLDPVKLRVVFLTHLHSDHTVGYPDLILTPWVLGRRVPLEVYGPSGIGHMTEHVLEAYSADFATRTKDRALYTVGAFPEGHAVNAHEIKPGVVYKDANVTVTAFATKHAMESYGYRFDTPDRSIVISGDTNPTQATIDACRGCDVLIHEVLTHDWLSRRPDFHAYAAQHHTTTTQLTELAKQAKPGCCSLSRLSVAAAGGGRGALAASRVAERDGALPGTRGRRPRSGRVLSVDPRAGNKKAPLARGFLLLWRRGWDSNPRRDVMPSTDFESVPL